MAQGKLLHVYMQYSYSYRTTVCILLYYCIDCPPHEGFGACIETCTDNSDCTNGQICCSNGCGQQCMTPVVDPCAVSVIITE